MIRETLRNLPEGLSDTYRRILIKISSRPSRAKVAQKVFKWATVAKRPLQVEELKEAVAFDYDDRSWNMDKIPHEDFMFESCMGLIIKNEDDGTAHFAHHTVRQYLIGGLTTNIDPQFGITIKNAEILAGQTCVAYLSFSDFETQITSTTTVRLEHKGVLESGGPLWIPSILGIRKPMFDVPYRLLRGDSALRRPSESDYWKHLVPKAKTKVSPSTHLIDKYRLLSYAIENWEPHTRVYDFDVLLHNTRLERLALHTTLAFEFRPWGPNQHFGPYGCIGCPNRSAISLVAKDLPHISMIHYAAEVGNLMLLVSGLTSGNSARLVSGLDSGNRYIYHERHHQETLLIACRQNRIEIVEYLTQDGKYDISDGSAIKAAAMAGHAEVLRYLFNLGHYSVKQQGNMALFLAAKLGHDAIITLLAEAGVDLDTRDQRTGRSVIETAALNGHESAIRALLKNGALLEDASIMDTSALHHAAAGGHLGATRALIESGIPTDHSDLLGKTALHYAAESGHENVAEILLEYGANPSFHAIRNEDNNNYGETPFHLAAKGGHVAVLELFRKHFAVKDYPLTGSEQAALQLVAAGSHVEVIRWLVEHESDVNSAALFGHTPLHLAIKLGDSTAVGVLLELGARGLSYSRSDLLTLAVEEGTISILGMLLGNLRGDQRARYEHKRAIIVDVLGFARKSKMIAAEELLEQELKLYPKGKRDDDLLAMLNAK